MKKILLGLVFIVSSLLADMNWTTYDKAFKQAKAENKTVMVLIGRSTCKVCNYMKTQVFTEKDIIEKFNEKFVGVEFMKDKVSVPENLEFIGTPTFYFLDSTGKIISTFSGGKNTKSFSKALDSIH
jgi:thioredoxin-related protein